MPFAAAARNGRQRFISAVSEAPFPSYRQPITTSIFLTNISKSLRYRYSFYRPIIVFNEAERPTQSNEMKE